MCTDIRKGPPGTPMTQSTVFGWVLFGKIDGDVALRILSLHCNVQLEELSMAITNGYNEFIVELIEMRHMEPTIGTTTDQYYMPHYPILQESRVTTKLRVGFNASRF